ncbi:MAG TPA: nitrogenase molybdenum-iron protein alpha chain [Termitinemataceae bacterium]|nr:nitrogenase molybdenum-iron protein alpha chain [Termitinemataceae bacterium]HPP99817.1 nitrogenase molybdenum-iron protein alpha chain [Termitinemataceae bacterium]
MKTEMSREDIIVEEGPVVVSQEAEKASNSSGVSEKSPVLQKDLLLEKYPTKVARKRDRHVVVNRLHPDGTVPEIVANERTAPGIITQRGCTYAGCKGVVIGPTRNILQITHGPIGCSFYSWLTRRNQTRPKSPDEPNFLPYCFTTNMEEKDIVFGGEKKLRAAVREAYEIFHPPAIALLATCPVGLIGDDIHAVARDMSEELGITVFAMSCEGYKGVSQSAGHHIANNALFVHVVGKDQQGVEGKFKINLLGEYNIGGDAFEIERLFEEAGLTLISTFSGNSTIEGMRNSPAADLNLVMCHRSLNYMAEMMEKKYGIPWIKVNFIGAHATAKSLRHIAAYFADAELSERIEHLIASEMELVKAVVNEIRPRLEGKKVALFVGGSRAHHYQELFKELGMEVIAAGYEFAHRDDYEGRRVLPSIQVDADSRNIENLEVVPDPALYRPRKSEEDLARLRSNGIEVNDYRGMMSDMAEGSLVIDDISHYELERIIELAQPDLICAGIKEKYVVQKHGIPMKQLHNYDYGGPYAGFTGAINFYREIDRLVNGSVWRLIPAPWERQPELHGAYVYG